MWWRPGIAGSDMCRLACRLLHKWGEFGGVQTVTSSPNAGVGWWDGCRGNRHPLFLYRCPGNWSFDKLQIRIDEVSLIVIVPALVTVAGIDVIVVGLVNAFRARSQSVRAKQ